jgi:hypothetical protein
MNPFDEITNITPIIFSKIYRKRFDGRKQFDGFVTTLIKQYNKPNFKYTYTSLYLRGVFTFHLTIKDDISFDMVTFGFSMTWDDKGFESYDMDNIMTYAGTPAYWFGRNEETNVAMEVKDEITFEL